MIHANFRSKLDDESSREGQLTEESTFLVNDVGFAQDDFIPEENSNIHIAVTICGQSVATQSLNLIKTAIIFSKKRIKFIFLADNEIKIRIKTEVIYILF